MKLSYQTDENAKQLWATTLDDPLNDRAISGWCYSILASHYILATTSKKCPKNWKISYFLLPWWFLSANICKIVHNLKRNRDIFEFSPFKFKSTLCIGVCMYIYGEKNFYIKKFKCLHTSNSIRRTVSSNLCRCGIKSEKNIATYHEVFFKGACEVIIFFFF